MRIDFNRLEGGQRKTLRLALIEAFGSSAELDLFLLDNNFEPLENYAAGGNFTHQVSHLIRELSKAGSLDKLMAAVLEEMSDYPALENLESRLLTPTSTPTDDSPRGVWMVPHGRNPYFTGRKDALSELHEALQSGGCAVVSGLGGIGKTQTAVEYVYRHRDEYEVVLWIRGATEGELAAGFGEVAQALGLAVDDAEQQLAAVHGWMDQNASWLLVIDDADDPDPLKPYYPPTSKGHILLTSRASYLGHLSIPYRWLLNTLSLDESRAFLLHRAGRKTPDTADELAAGELAEELDFLPLALEQAGAYIAAKQARFDDYLADYQEFRTELVTRSKPETAKYPQGFEETWNLSFQEVEQHSQASGDVLRLSAFLSPERIPEELLIEGASKLGSAISGAISEALGKSGRLQLDDLLEPLTHYSLVERHPQERSYSVHPLVQEVVKANLGEESRKSWEQRVAQSLDQTFPKVELGTWGQFARLLPHVQAFRLGAGRPLESLESARVFGEAASYLRAKGRYAEAEPLFQSSLEIYEMVLEGDHLSLAMTLNNQAILYQERGRYAEAEPLLKRALEIYEMALEGKHQEFAAMLKNLALLYSDQGRQEEAEPLHHRSLKIYEKALEGDQPDHATILKNLANLYRLQGRYEEAEPLCRRSLEIQEKALGREHPELATTLDLLAQLFYGQGRYEEIEPLYQRALEIHEKALQGTHPDLVTMLKNLARVFRHQDRDDDAEPLYQRALEIQENASRGFLNTMLGRDHPDLADTLDELANFYYGQGRYDDAEPLYKRVLEIQEKALEGEHPKLVSTLNNLANLYFAQDRYEEAEPLYKRVLETQEKTLGREHPELADTLNNLATLYRYRGRYKKAEPLYQRALEIKQRELGGEHPELANTLNNLAILYHKWDRYSEAEPTYQRALEILEKALGDDHSSLVTMLNNLATLYRDQSRDEEADELTARAESIRKKK